MIWLTWRQFRVQAASVLAALVLISVTLAVTGPDVARGKDFTDEKFLYYGGMYVVCLLPAVIGAFWGVPMVTRELETGTLNLVWNQTVTRQRWLATKLGIGVAAAMVAAGLLSLAVGWWASPIDTAVSLDADSTFDPRVSPVVFAARGIVPIGYAAFALVLGVAIGILVRRTASAMAVTLVVFAAVQVAIPLAVRPHLLPATEQTVTITAESIEGVRAEEGSNGDVAESLTVTHPAGAWVLADETVGPDGNAVSPLPDAVNGCLRPPSGHGGSMPDRGQIHMCFAQLSDSGYHQRLVYQPAGRFWPLQWLEAAMFLALSALLTLFCFRRLRHLP